MYFYDDFAGDFDAKMNKHETSKRLHIIFDNILNPGEIKGKKFLDAGSGTGWFSKKASEIGASVTSLDVGENILSEVAKKCDTTRVVGSILEIPFPDATFDIVVSTEVIEHTPNPRQAISELCRVLKPSGILIVTVPNRIWLWSCLIANALKLRPYEGYENWVWYRDLKKWVEEEDSMHVEQHFGFNIIPCVFKFTYPFIDFCDRWGDSFGWMMVNTGIRAAKKIK
jgi:ubiquinone/menaquinone biosynthesis C-methylase UbiE